MTRTTREDSPRESEPEDQRSRRGRETSDWPFLERQLALESPPQGQEEELELDLDLPLPPVTPPVSPDPPLDLAAPWPAAPSLSSPEPVPLELAYPRPRKHPSEPVTPLPFTPTPEERAAARRRAAPTGRATAGPSAAAPGSEPALRGRPWIIARPEPEKRPLWTKVLLVLVLGAVALGITYGYNRYEVSDREHALAGKGQTAFHDRLRALGKRITPDDVRQVVHAMAADLELEVTQLQVSIAALSTDNIHKIPNAGNIGTGVALEGGDMSKLLWVVGYRGTFSTRSGLAHKQFAVERYTWFQDVDTAAMLRERAHARQRR